MLHLQEFFRSLLNVLPDLVTVSWPIEKRPQEEHVKRSLEGPTRCCACYLEMTFFPKPGTDGRCSTIDCQGAYKNVGARMSIISAESLNDAYACLTRNSQGDGIGRQARLR